jgi:hypothetical protein
MTEILTKIVVNCATGETTEIPLTQAELEQRELDRLAFEKAEADNLKAETQKAALQASANAKLEALGLTSDEIAALKS